MNPYRTLLLVVLSIVIPSASFADPVLVPSDRLIDPDVPPAIVRPFACPPNGLFDLELPPRFATPGATEELTGGWTPLEVVFAEDGLRPNLHFDSDGTEHLLWMSSNAILHTTKDSSGWRPPETLYSTWEQVFKFGSDRGPNGNLWYVFHARVSGGRRIFVGHSEDGTWIPPVRISPDDGFLHFSPNIAVGNDAVWVTWYSQPYFSYPTDHVFVVRGSSEGWGEPLKLTAEMPGNHWFSDIAVDSEDRGHLVWGDSQAGLYYYATSTDGISWSQPFAINPHLLGVYAAGWPGCSVVCDADDNVHVVWTGRRILDGGTLADWDIFYSTCDGEYWTSPAQVNVDNETVDAYPNIVVGLEGELWVNWMDGNPASMSEYRVRCARSFDGTSWTEWRLDDDTYYYDHSGLLAIDNDGVPWAVWNADYVNFQDKPGAIVGTHFDPSVAVRTAVVEGLGLESAAEIRWRVDAGDYAAFEIDRAGENDPEVVARITATGAASYTWTDTGVPAGVWTYTVEGSDRTGHNVTLGLATVEVGAAPPRMVVRYLGRSGPGAYRLRVGSPANTVLDLAEFDVQGRVIAREGGIAVQAGWQEVRWEADRLGASCMPAGVYWIRVRDGQGRTAVARVVELPSP